MVSDLPWPEDLRIGDLADPLLDAELRRRWGLHEPGDEPVSSFNNFI